MNDSARYPEADPSPSEVLAGFTAGPDLAEVPGDVVRYARVLKLDLQGAALAGGRRFEGHEPIGLGDYRNPLTTEQVIEKYESLARRVLGSADVAAFMAVKTLLDAAVRLRGDVVLEYVVGELQGGHDVSHVRFGRRRRRVQRDGARDRQRFRAPHADRAPAVPLRRGCGCGAMNALMSDFHAICDFGGRMPAPGLRSGKNRVDIRPPRTEPPVDGIRTGNANRRSSHEARGDGEPESPE